MDGLGVARRIAHLTYRSAVELGERFGTRVQEDGRFAVASYLDHHADKLAGRSEAGSYVLLTEAMNSWDAGRGRGGVEAALTRVTARSVVAGVDSDRLYPIGLQQQVAESRAPPWARSSGICSTADLPPARSAHSSSSAA